MEAPETKMKRRRRIGWWIFIIANLAGLIIAFPLFSAAGPLLRIWWTTRSQESVTQQVHATNADGADSNGAKHSAQPVQGPPPLNVAALTNQLDSIEHVSEDQLRKIIEQQFGPRKKAESDPSKFDQDTAVFHEIRRFIAVADGKEYYCYEIDLADQHGNHKTHVDCFEQPDVDYERSMATLNLVRENPQLKRIYEAFSHVLAEKSRTNVSTNMPAPAFRLESPEQ